jgi:CDP-diacylglycerol--serine O-phosphatidyltransferase
MKKNNKEVKQNNKQANANYVKKIKENKTDYFNMMQFVKLADLFTLCNAVCGILSIYFVLNMKIVTAALFILLATFFDKIDGWVARKMGTQNEFGKQLDSLCDIISFGIAPAFFGIISVASLWLIASSLWFKAILVLYLVAVIFYVAAGILRLARFNVTDQSKSFQGLPITVGGLFIALIVLFVSLVPTYLPVLKPFVSVLGMLMPLVYLILGLLMISSIPIRKR